jgi:hypothetical protein
MHLSRASDNVEQCILYLAPVLVLSTLLLVDVAFMLPLAPLSTLHSPLSTVVMVIEVMLKACGLSGILILILSLLQSCNVRTM